MDSSDLVYTVVRQHFQIEDCEQRKLQNSKHFNRYFMESCSYCDLKSLTYESSPEGTMEVLDHLSKHLLSKFGLYVYRKQYRRLFRSMFRYNKTLDALLLA